jgi:hypothetical protein
MTVYCFRSGNPTPLFESGAGPCCVKRHTHPGLFSPTVTPSSPVSQDDDRRRVYDMQRDARAQPESSSPSGPRTHSPHAGGSFRRAGRVLFWPGQAARVALTGRPAPSAFGLFSEVSELSKYNLQWMGMQRGNVLVFVYLRGSERCERAKRAIR